MAVSIERVVIGLCEAGPGLAQDCACWLGSSLRLALHRLPTLSEPVPCAADVFEHCGMYAYAEDRALQSFLASPLVTCTGDADEWVLSAEVRVRVQESMPSMPLQLWQTRWA